ncbi:glycosyltransferase [bacterium]|nr:glycosyltransferase [bacterium]
MQEPTISFLLVTYNHERFIARSLESLFWQDVDSLELIICDDCSTDNTQQVILETIADKKPPHIVIKLSFAKSNRGLMNNIKNGVKLAKSEFLVVGSGDDEFIETRMSDVQKIINQNLPSIKGLYSDAVVIDENGDLLKHTYTNGPSSDDFDVSSMSKSNSGFLGSTSVYHTDVWRCFPDIDPRIFQEDTVLPFRAAILGTIHFSNEKHTKYRLHSQNLYFGDNSMLSYTEVISRAKKPALNRLLIQQQRLNDLNHAIENKLLSGDIECQQSILKNVSYHLEIQKLEASLAEKSWLHRCFTLLSPKYMFQFGYRKYVRICLLYVLPFAYFLHARHSANK